MAVGFRLWPASTDAAVGRRLLLLRVFGYQRRIERLFDAIAQRWRLSGGVKLIAPADLATRIVDPADVVAFMGGRMRDRFVAGPSDLGRHLARIDDTPDPDGRYRIDKFFCHDDTWQPLLQSLLDRSDVVLFDLRGFSPANSGCRFELGQLAGKGLLPRTVMVVDGSTDIAHLRTVLAEAAGGLDWERATAGPSGAMLIEQVRPRSALDLERVRRRLTEAASAPRA